MTEDTKKLVRRRVWDGGKLIAVIGALTSAITGYNHLMEKQAQLLYVMSTKLNAVSEKVAYLEGRMDGQSPEVATEIAKVRQQPVSDVVVEAHPKPDKVPAPPRPAPASNLPEKPEVAADMVEVEGDSMEKSPMVVPKKIRDVAYQQVPVNIEDLEPFQKQLQLQEEMK